MVSKNEKKEQAKKYRNLWGINPRTRTKDSKKHYTRKNQKPWSKDCDF